MGSRQREKVEGFAIEFDLLVCSKQQHPPRESRPPVQLTEIRPNYNPQKALQGHLLPAPDSAAASTLNTTTHCLPLILVVALFSANTH